MNNRNELPQLGDGKCEYEEVSAIDCCYHDAHKTCMKYNKECHEPCDEFEINADEYYQDYEDDDV